MNAPIGLTVLGRGALSAPLFNHGAPLGRIRLVEHDAQAVLIDLPPAERVAAVVPALAAGQFVLCPPPVAFTPADLAAISDARIAGGGVLLPAGELAHCEAGRRGLAAIAAPTFGPLRTLYLAIRQPRGSGGDVLADLLPEALDTVLALLPGPFSTFRVNAGALFVEARDTAVILLRSAGDVVVTLELSRCLPPTLPAPGLGDVEIDAMGAAQAVRIVPNASALRIYRDDGLSAAPWLDAPVLAMLRALEAAGVLALSQAIAAQALVTS